MTSAAARRMSMFSSEFTILQETARARAVGASADRRSSRYGCGGGKTGRRKRGGGRPAAGGKSGGLEGRRPANWGWFATGCFWLLVWIHSIWSPMDIEHQKGACSEIVIRLRPLLGGKWLISGWPD